MVVGPCGRGLVRAALSRPDTGAAEDRGAGTGGVPAPSLINVANALTVARLCLVPVFVVLLLTGGDAARIAACVTFGVASATDFLDGELARLAQPDHRLRQDRGSDRGQGADRLGTDRAVGPRRAALVGDGRDPVPRGCRDRPAVLGHIARRHRGQPRRQGEDAASGGRDRPVHPARAVPDRPRAGDGGRAGRDGADRRGLRGPRGPAAPGQARPAGRHRRDPWNPARTPVRCPRR